MGHVQQTFGAIGILSWVTAAMSVIESKEMPGEFAVNRVIPAVAR